MGTLWPAISVTQRLHSKNRIRARLSVRNYTQGSGVSKVFSSKKVNIRAVNNVSFNVSKGETIAIVGNRAAERQRSGTV